MPEQEKKLVEDAKKNPEQFAALYDRYFDEIYRYVLRRVSDRETAQDLVSQTFYDALAHIKNFEWRGFSFGCWLYKIAHNNILKWYRTEQKKGHTDIEEGYEIPDTQKGLHEQVVVKENQDEVQAALAQLDPEEREILRLKFFEEMSNIEIAEIMGVSANHIGVKIFRALKRFKQYFA